MNMKKSIQENLKEAQEKNPSLSRLPIKSYKINMSEIRLLFKNIKKSHDKKELIK
jgi:hypothetical protein